MSNRRDRRNFFNHFSFGRHFPVKASSEKNLNDALIAELQHRRNLLMHQTCDQPIQTDQSVELQAIYIDSLVEQISKENERITSIEIDGEVFKVRYANETVDLAKPPGALIASITDLIYSKKTRELVFEPILADFRHEYFEELTNSASPGKLRFVQIRHWGAFLLAVVHQLISSMAKVIQVFKSAG